MSYKAYATFLHINGSSGEEYRIRFNKVSGRLLDGTTRVEMGKTENYLVMIPISKNSPFGFNVSRDQIGVPSVSMTKLVKHNGFLPRDMFDASRFAVRRGKTGDNKIYICLKERIEDDGKGQGTPDAQSGE